jgi:hypothetical protein
MAGKKIGMLAGTYPCSSLQSGSSPEAYQYPVLHLPQGSSGSPTVLQSVSGPGTVILDNSTSSSENPLIGQNPDLAGYWGPVGSNYGGMIMQGVQGAIIKNNFIHDIQKPADEPHCHCYEEYGCLGTQIHYNTFANCPGGGIDLKAGVSGADIAYNYFYNCALSAPTNGIGSVTGADGAEGNPNSPGTANAAHHNIFDSCGAVHAGDVNSTAAQNLYYYNNTIYDTRSGSNVVADPELGMERSVKSDTAPRDRAAHRTEARPRRAMPPLKTTTLRARGAMHRRRSAMDRRPRPRRATWPRREPPTGALEAMAPAAAVARATCRLARRAHGDPFSL